jgi:hypothetical protein
MGYISFWSNDVNLLGENTNIRKKNTEALLGAGKKTGLEVNAGSICTYVFIRLQDKIIIQRQLANKSFKNAAKLKYSGMITNQN